MFTLILFICNVILLVCVLKSIKADKARQAEEEAKARKNKELRRKNLEFFIPKVRSAKSLRELFTLHIQIWASGIQHSNFGPDQYGIFRTQDILKMRPEEVFLGNIVDCSPIRCHSGRKPLMRIASRLSHHSTGACFSVILSICFRQHDNNICSELVESTPLFGELREASAKMFPLGDS